MAQIKYVAVFLLLFVSSSVLSEVCQKDRTQLLKEKRSCPNTCSPDKPCRNSKANCICDGACGFVCILPTMECLELKPPANGYVNTKDGFKYRATAIYGCNDPNFELVGQQERNCQSDGTWSGPEPFCTTQGVRCSRPSFNISNAEISSHPKTQEEFYLDEEVTYKCKRGYSQIRTVTTKCVLKDDELGWTPIRLLCNIVKCLPPEYVSNAIINGDDFTFGKQIYYECNDGYKINGIARRECLYNREWSGFPPTCEVVTCRVPSSTIENGHVDVSVPLEYGSYVTYECDDGFALEGNKERECDKNGRLTGEEPQCKEIDCGDPKEPENGFIKSKSGTKLNGRVIYQCNDLTTTTGGTLATCNADSKWSQKPPLCLRHCLVLYAPNSHFAHKNRPLKEGNYIKHGETVDLICNNGFELPANKNKKFVEKVVMTTCEDESWSKTINCQPIRCFERDFRYKNLKDRNLKLRKNIGFSAKHEETIDLECDNENPEAVAVLGSIKCQFGQWIYPKDFDVRCRKRSCDVTGLPETRFWFRYKDTSRFISLRDIGQILHDEKIEIFCRRTNNEVYIEDKLSSFIECSDGSLSGTQFECKPGRCLCSDLDVLIEEKGMESHECENEKIAHEAMVNVQCASGFSGDFTGLTATCKNAEWKLSTKTVVCLKMCSCRNLRFGKDFVLMDDCNDYVESGETLRAKCKANFVGKNLEATCEQGEWKVEQGTCFKFCSVPDDPNAIFEQLKRIRYAIARKDAEIADGATIRYSCEEGYHFYDREQYKYVKCSDGEFLQREECLEDEPTSESEEGENTDKNENDNRQEIFFSTTKNVDLFASKEETMEEKEEETTVTSIEHTKPGKIVENCIYDPEDQFLLAFNEKKGSIKEKTSFELSEQIIFRCIDIGHYILDGSNLITCMQNGWDKDLPTCKRLSHRSSFEPPVITFDVNDDHVVGPNGMLIVTEDASLTFSCWWFKSRGQPIWQLNNRDIFDSEDLITEWVENNSKFNLIIKKFSQNDNGKYSCKTPYDKKHSIDVRIKPSKKTTVESTSTTVTTTSSRPEPITFKEIPLTRAPQTPSVCEAGDPSNLDIFENGNPMATPQKTFNHESILRFRCSDSYKFKLVGNHLTICQNGIWSEGWPSCIQTDQFDWYGSPPIRVYSRSSPKKLENGELLFPTNQVIHLACEFFSREPHLLLNDRDITDINPKLTTGYTTRHGYYVIIGPYYEARSFKFQCLVPHNPPNMAYSNSIVVRFGRNCDINKEAVDRKFKAEIVPASIRYPTYAEGDKVYLKCTNNSKGKRIPRFITCRDTAGIWENSSEFFTC